MNPTPVLTVTKDDKSTSGEDHAHPTLLGAVSAVPSSPISNASGTAVSSDVENGNSNNNNMNINTSNTQDATTPPHKVSTFRDHHTHLRDYQHPQNLTLTQI